jgi:biopolymer transport protein ExbB/TolQ
MHYVIVGIFIAIIICLQIQVFISTLKKIKFFKSIFPDSVKSFSLKENDSNCTQEDLSSGNDEVSQILCPHENSTLKAILETLNQYLVKNRGAASDFNLMKDVVERYTESKNEEISVQQPITLYLGLAGTMIGIIVGISYIAISGNLTSSIMMTDITALMICVAIAMSSSLLGVSFTTTLSWMAKKALTEVEQKKNDFYSWLQTELLPTLSGNTASALSLLQQNLISFNQTFNSNIKNLDTALATVSNTTKDQADFITQINGLDIKKIAQSNILVLKDLQSCTSKLEVFNQYMQNVTSYLNAVQQLNTNIGNSMERTKSIEQLGDFLQRELNQFNIREDKIKEVVGDVDSALMDSVHQLKESMQSRIQELKDSSISQEDSLEKAVKDEHSLFGNTLKTQQDNFIKLLEEQQQILVKALKDRQNQFETTVSEISTVLTSESGLLNASATISNLANLTKEGNSKLDLLITSINNLGDKDESTIVESPQERFQVDKFLSPKVFRIVFLVIAGFIALMFVMYTYHFVSGFFAN